MEKIELETNIKKGFANGKALREKLVKEQKENQINGIAYSILNSLKIQDKERFLDTYIRLMMTHNISIYFSKDEMLEINKFLNFGYSFINGLLNEYNKKEGEKNE